MIARLSRLILGKPDPVITAQARYQEALHERQTAWRAHRRALDRGDCRLAGQTRRALTKAQTALMRAEVELDRLRSTDGVRA